MGSRRRWFAVLLALAVLAGVGVLVARPTGRAPAQKLNVIVIVSDDQRDAMDKMPYTSSRSDWVKLERAFINEPLCCPSRATILSGLNSNHTGVTRNRDGGKFEDGQSLATWLSHAGYRTGLFGKYLNGYPFGKGAGFIPPGWDEWRAFMGEEGGGNGNQDYYRYALAENGKTVRYGSGPTDYSTDVLARDASDFIRTSDKPFFVYLAPYAPHDPWYPPPRHAGAYRHERIVFSPAFNESNQGKPASYRRLPRLSRQSVARMRRAHDEALLGMDDAVRRVFRTLRETGKESSTVVIYLTDNGYSFGDHRWPEKDCPYEGCVHTPLWIRYPGVSGRRVWQLASNADIAPTVTDIAGTKPGIPVDGYSLLPLIRGGSKPLRDAVLLYGVKKKTKLPTFWALRTTRYKFIASDTGEQELYDLARDPFELTNLIDAPSQRSLRARLSRRLEVLKREPPHGE